MNDMIKNFIDNKDFTAETITCIIENSDSETDNYIFSVADKIRIENYSREVFVRGLIEFSNYCKNNCYYCGLQCCNKNIERYRLTDGEILECCENGYALGFRTFVLQSGEDNFYTDEHICEIVRAIKKKFPDVAVTLSIGEKSRETYSEFFNAGAERYLLRHETATKSHYEKLHPSSMSFDNRMRCLRDLKEIGFQTGAGFMVGSPYQTSENLANDLLFIKNFRPHMVGIGPFIPQGDTIFKDKEKGTLRDTLLMVALTRIILPHALIPATTALGTIHPQGRELGLKAGANVVMPNLSPVRFRKLYSIYDDKICTGEEAGECKGCLERRVQNAGYQIVTDRGDYRE